MKKIIDKKAEEFRNRAESLLKERGNSEKDDHVRENLREMWAYFGSDLYEAGFKHAELVADELQDAELSQIFEELKNFRY